MTVSLTVSDLFTPAPSGVGPFGNVPAVPASGTWFGISLQIAATVLLIAFAVALGVIVYFFS